MILRHPGISPTNDLVAKKIFSNPEITCQFIRDMLDLPAKNVTILEGSNIHVLPSMPYSAQDFYTSIDVLAELDNGTQVIPPAVSLAATKAIAFAFSSCSYLDVSVHCVFLYITLTVMSDRHYLPGSPIRTSLDHCSLTAPQSLPRLSGIMKGYIILR